MKRSKNSSGSCKKYPTVEVTVVGVKEIDVEKCKEIATDWVPIPVQSPG
jgi:hypothetical protein